MEGFSMSSIHVFIHKKKAICKHNWRVAPVMWTTFILENCDGFGWAKMGLEWILRAKVGKAECSARQNRKTLFLCLKGSTKEKRGTTWDSSVEDRVGTEATETPVTGWLESFQKQQCQRVKLKLYIFRWHYLLCLPRSHKDCITRWVAGMVGFVGNWERG